jgi:hypothetical protein
MIDYIEKAAILFVLVALLIVALVNIPENDEY